MMVILNWADVVPYVRPVMENYRSPKISRKTHRNGSYTVYVTCQLNFIALMRPILGI